MFVCTPKRLVPWLVSTILLAAAMASTRGTDAAVIFDNFDVGGGFHPTDNIVAASAHRSGGSASAVRAAAKFSVMGGDYSLDSVTLPISETASSHVLRVRIATDAGGAPGTTLEVLSEN